MDDGTIHLYPGGFRGPVYSSPDGLTFTQVQGAESASDPAIVRLDDGTYRLYYSQPIGAPGPSQVLELHSSTSSNALTWTQESGVRYADLGNGVPEVVALPDGGWRLYYMTHGTGGGTISSATSPDGLTFTFEQSDLLPPGYVDPAVEYVGDGQWLMVMSTFATKGSVEGFTQDIHLATSSDGVAWDLDTDALIDDPDVNSFDPTLIRLDASSYRVYYSEQPVGSFGGDPAQIASALLEIPAAHTRTVSLSLGKHLIAGGKVGAAGDTSQCIASVRVKVQRRVGTAWTTVATDRTDAGGKYSAELADKPGKYRAKVSSSTAGLVTCGAATSTTATHAH
ncbi:MAG: hypothetical protein QOG04_431 [Actinomycetota bacterium]|nr:hypothetical protein [Actinomycetota bacterium]